MITIINERTNQVCTTEARVADTFFSRLQGLMFKKNWNEDDCLIINPCNSIHMFFMRFPLDIVFVDKDNVIVHIIENIKPWRMSKLVFNSQYVLELHAHSAQRFDLKVGDKIILTTKNE